jgi:hypothetical protein
LVLYEGDLSIYRALIAVADYLMHQVRVWAGKSEPECALGTLASSGYRGKLIQTCRAGHTSVTGATIGNCGSGESDVQDEVPEVKVQLSAAGPVHDERQEDDGEDNDHQPEEKHDNAGNCVPANASSSHGRQLPGAS